jgi:hypothetical protein
MATSLDTLDDQRISEVRALRSERKEMVAKIASLELRVKELEEELKKIGSGQLWQFSRFRIA